jgi:hypothetical protein
MSGCEVFVREGAIFVMAQLKTDIGVCVWSSSAQLPGDAPPGVLGAAVLKALADFREKGESLDSVMDNPKRILRDLKFKSMKAFTTGARCLLVEAPGPGRVAITPTRAEKGAFLHQVDARAEYPATAEDVGRGLLERLQSCA